MFTDYEAPPDPDVGMPYKVLTNNGTDWTLGTPSDVYPGFGVHDAWIDADGTSIYFTGNNPNNILWPSFWLAARRSAANIHGAGFLWAEAEGATRGIPAHRSV